MSSRGIRHLALTRLVDCLFAASAGEALDCVEDHESMADAHAAMLTSEDPQRFLEIYERHYDRIFNYLYRRCGDRDVAADLASRTFLNALEWLQSRPPRAMQIRPWLYRIATTVHLQHVRQHGRWVARIPLLGMWVAREAGLPNEALARDQENAVLARHLRALPEKYRTALVLRFYEELSYREIADVLNLADASARSRVSRGLEKLAQAMKDTP